MTLTLFHFFFSLQPIFTRNDNYLEDYPVGLLAFTLDYNIPFEDYLSDGVGLIARATGKFTQDHKANMEEFVHGGGCSHTRSREQIKLGTALYRWVMGYRDVLACY